MSKFVELELQSGTIAVFHLVGDFVITKSKEKDSVVCISNVTHNNGGWKLAPKYSLLEVVELFKNN
jgi:hypothetical protein